MLINLLSRVIFVFSGIVFFVAITVWDVINKILCLIYRVVTFPCKNIRLYFIKTAQDLFICRSKYERLESPEKELWNINISLISKYSICLEDRRFYKHKGFDAKAFLREIYKFFIYKTVILAKLLKINRYGGASTIDMQLVRTITNYREITVGRKLYEISLAILLNRKFTKQEILHSYLDIAYFGSKLKGVQKAVKIVFNKNIYSDVLIDEEASIIAAMLLVPKPLNASLLDNSRWSLRVNFRAQYAQELLKFS